MNIKSAERANPFAFRSEGRSIWHYYVEAAEGGRLARLFAVTYCEAACKRF